MWDAQPFNGTWLWKPLRKFICQGGMWGECQVEACTCLLLRTRRDFLPQSVCSKCQSCLPQFLCLVGISKGLSLYYVVTWRCHLGFFHRKTDFILDTSVNLPALGFPLQATESQFQYQLFPLQKSLWFYTDCSAWGCAKAELKTVPKPKNLHLI